MRNKTDKQIIITLGWMQNTLRARGEDYATALKHLAEAEKLFRVVVDAPIRATDSDSEELPAMVTRFERLA